MNWLQNVKKWSLPKAYPTVRGGRVPPDMYHFQLERDGQFARFHLRVEPDGRSLLIACASEAVILSPVATQAAWYILSSKETSDVPTEVVESVGRLIQEIGTPSARYPILQLDDPDATGHGPALAPVQADLLVDETTPIVESIDRLWAARIPHVRLRNAQAGLGDHLVQAVEHAEDVGMIAGLRSASQSVGDGDVLDRLAGAGLDYVVVPWGVTAATHRALFGGDAETLVDHVDRIGSLEMTPVLEIPLVEATIDALEDELPKWLNRGVAHIEVFALSEAATDAVRTDSARRDAPSPAELDSQTSGIEPLKPQSLRQVAAWIDDLSGAHEISISWLPPVQVLDRSALDRQTCAGPRTGGRLSVRVELDGTVIPPSGPSVAAGNLLHDRWETIWHHAAFEAIRRRRKEFVYCDQCPRLDVCTSGCPADPQTWATPQG